MDNLGLMEESHETMNRLTDSLIEKSVDIQKELSEIEPVTIIVDGVEFFVPYEHFDTPIRVFIDGLMLKQQELRLVKYLENKYGRDNMLTFDQAKKETLLTDSQLRNAYKLFYDDGEINKQLLFFDIEIISQIIMMSASQDESKIK